MNCPEIIRNFSPWDDGERADKETALEAFRRFSDLWTRDNPFIHLTASAFVFNPEKTKALMVYHLIYDSWSWVGGHADGNRDLLSVARRELEEETGLSRGHPLQETPISLEILTVKGHVKNRRHISPHLHLNLTWAFRGREDAPLRPAPKENSRVGWIPLRELERFVTEPEMLPIYRKIIHKCKDL